ncbi:hypothetical protein Tco_0969007 [Tanacetum coccineum]
MNNFSKHNVYSTQKILGVKSVSVKKLNGYGHLEEVVVKRDNRQLYKFKEGDFIDLHLNDIEDMFLVPIIECIGDLYFEPLSLSLSSLPSLRSFNLRKSPTASAVDEDTDKTAKDMWRAIERPTTRNKLYFQAEKEAIFLILTGIGDEIYSISSTTSTRMVKICDGCQANKK